MSDKSNIPTTAFATRSGIFAPAGHFDELQPMVFVNISMEFVNSQRFSDF